MTAQVATGLSVRNLRVAYGRVVAVSGISFDVPEGCSVGMIGANGAGKSSTLKAIFRLVDSRSDAISYGGRSIGSTPAHQIVGLGLGYVPEGRRIFAGLSVHRNLLMGAYGQRWRTVTPRLDHVYEIFPALKQFENTLAGALSGGQQQMLSIGRALMSSPKLLVLDEPSMGLSPVLINDIAAALRRLRAEGVSMLLVEQNAKLTFGLTDRCLVLENGARVNGVTSAELDRHEALVRD